MTLSASLVLVAVRSGVSPSSRRCLTVVSSSSAHYVVKRCFSDNRPAASESSSSESSSTGSSTDNNNNNNNNTQDYQHPQDFVKVKLEPGEWDPYHTDPLYRPPWKSNAKIISEEDFANRPKAGFGEEFDSMHDAMNVLSWLSQDNCDKIYQTYVDMMSSMSTTGRGVTSHEYVVRVIGQKFNISAGRVAAVIQLAHNEDQIRKNGGKIHYKVADYVEQKIQEHIRNAYEAYGEEPPHDVFVEDPMGCTGGGDPDRQTSAVDRVEDLFDADDLMEKALVREKDEARLAIDNHIYIEDVDETQIPVKVDADCEKLLKIKKEIFDEATTTTGDYRKDRSEDLTPLPEGGSGERKARFKFVAHTINTREEKKKMEKNKKTLMSKRARRERLTKVEGNTIVEENGTLRVATVDEVKNTSWKPVRNVKEFTYAGVKQAWIDRTVHGKTGTWGRFEDKHKDDDEDELSPAQDPLSVDTATPDDESSESSSSDESGSESSSDSSDEEEEEEAPNEEDAEDDDGDKKDDKKEE